MHIGKHLHAVLSLIPHLLIFNYFSVSNIFCQIITTSISVLNVRVLTGIFLKFTIWILWISLNIFISPILDVIFKELCIFVTCLLFLFLQKTVYSMIEKIYNYQGWTYVCLYINIYKDVSRQTKEWLSCISREL